MISSDFVDASAPTLAALTQVLRHEIVLANALAVSAVAYTDQALTLHAPLSANLNHKCTAFGGSLYSVAVLAGWGLVYQKMAEYGLSGQIVIQHSEAQYLAPVAEDLYAVASLPDNWPSFVKMLHKKGRGRVVLVSEVLAQGQLAFRLTATFVVLPAPPV